MNYQLLGAIDRGEPQLSEIKEIIENKHVNLKIPQAYMYLQSAVIRNSFEVVKYLLEKGVTTNMNIHMSMAIGNHNEEMGKLFIDYGATVPSLDSHEMFSVRLTLKELATMNPFLNEYPEYLQIKDTYDNLIKYELLKKQEKHKENKNMRRVINQMRNKYESKVGGPNVAKLIGKYAGMEGGKTKKRKQKKRKTIKRKTKAHK